MLPARGNDSILNSPRIERSSIHDIQKCGKIISIMRSRMRHLKRLKPSDTGKVFHDAFVQVEEVKLGKKMRRVRKIYVRSGLYKVFSL